MNYELFLLRDLLFLAASEPESDAIVGDDNERASGTAKQLVYHHSLVHRAKTLAGHHLRQQDNCESVCVRVVCVCVCVCVCVWGVCVSCLYTFSLWN